MILNLPILSQKLPTSPQSPTWAEAIEPQRLLNLNGSKYNRLPNEYFFTNNSLPETNSPKRRSINYTHYREKESYPNQKLKYIQNDSIRI